LEGFAYGSSIAFLSAMFLAGGAAHATGFERFRKLIRSHGVLPPGWVGALTFAVTALELALGFALALAVLLLEAGFHDVAAVIGCAAAGFAFLSYLRGLLRKPVRPVSCGCSLLSSALTPWSVVPAVAVLIAAAVALPAALLGGAEALRAEPSVRLLSACWGVTLAWLVAVLPAVVAPAATGRA
jgi:hypothetical protein